MIRLIWLVCSCFFLIFTGCSEKKLDFTSILKIDAHVHIRYTGPEFLDQAVDDNFKTIVILTDHYDIHWQQDFINQQRKSHPNQFQYLTTFSMEGWDEPDWQEKTIAHLEKSFEYGATGVKVWKDIGMEFKDANGQFIKIDHPRFDSVIDFIESQNKTLAGHIGEPKDCWLPIDKMIASSNKRYYSSHPEYHMALHPEYPSYEDQIQSYEHMLEKHPNLRYVGCHLASIEWSMKELGKMLDKFPHMAVDLAARIDDIQLLDREEVRTFFIKYQDRILYATDLSIKESHDPEEYAEHSHKVWLRDWTYFSTDSIKTIKGIDQPVRGLELPLTVLKKIYQTNAQKWYPGI